MIRKKNQRNSENSHGETNAHTSSNGYTSNSDISLEPEIRAAPDRNMELNKLKGKNSNQNGLDFDPENLSSDIAAPLGANPNSIGQSPSLKLKIRLSGKIKDNISSSAENISFSFNKDGLLKEGSDTPNQVSQSDNTESNSNPLKITIKKANIPSSSPNPNINLNQSKPVLITITPFPKLNDHPLFQKSVSSSSNYARLSEWNDKDMAGLKDELENMRHTIREFSEHLDSQIDVLEHWKNPNYKRDNLRKSSTGVPRQNKRQKTNGEFGTIDDLDYEEAIDDIDIMDEDPYAFDDKPIKQKNKKSGSSKKGSGNRNRQQQQQVTPIPPNLPPQLPSTPQTPLGSTGQEKKEGKMGKVRGSGPASRAGTRDKNRNKKSADDASDSGDDFGYSKAKGTFWNEIEPFFAPFTEADLKFISPVNPDQDDSVVQIPPLGKHYREQWAEEDHEVYDPEKFARSQSENGEEMESDRPVACGDLTSRILSALIEENIVPASIGDQLLNTPTNVNLLSGSQTGASVNNLSQNIPKENGTVEDPKFISNLPTSQSQKIEKEGLSDAAFPLETPPTYDYSYTGMLTLEERIKLELRSIGLLDDEDLEISNQREDDEICSEIRKLQKQLRDRIVQNNLIRSKLHSMLPSLMQKEENDKKEKSAQQALEKSFQKLMVKKKKNKRPTT